MTLDTKQQVLLALYMEYQKDIPRMKDISCTTLNMDIDVFNIALKKLETEGYITGLYTLPADNDMFYIVMLDNVSLTKDGIEYVESRFGINKELTAEDKIKYIIKKCGVLGFQTLKIFGAEILRSLADTI